MLICKNIPLAQACSLCLWLWHGQHVRTSDMADNHLKYSQLHPDRLKLSK